MNFSITILIYHCGIKYISVLEPNSFELSVNLHIYVCVYKDLLIM